MTLGLNDDDLEKALPAGVRARMVAPVNGLAMNVLEAGFEHADRPAIILLHGFPELAYSWRRVMPVLASAGFHVIAPDQRGYGRTTGWDDRFDTDLRPFRPLNLVRDILGLVAALGISRVTTVVGHDYGSMVAAWCALIRPDLFGSVVLMSAPFGGPPPLRPAEPATDINAALAALTPPRKHYHAYYATVDAAPNLSRGTSGLHDFLRAYYHHKSADWAGNTPTPLAAWTATELARLPTYYVMNLHDGMAETVAREMPSAAAISACKWLPDHELAVYSREYSRTGFQGGLNWYRCRFVPEFNDELTLFAGRTIDVPSCFIAGRQDWGIHQRPGEFERMQTSACTQMQECHLVDDAGHWVQQEQAAEVARRLVDFSIQQLSKA